jgi:hypothetical protein
VEGHVLNGVILSAFEAPVMERQAYILFTEVWWLDILSKDIVNG